MNIISWNSQRLGNPRTVQDLCRMVRVKKPVMVFLMETKMRQKRMEKIRHKLGFSSPQADFTWKFTGFYGHPEASKRHEAWALLRYLGHLDPLPWMCIGGFNEVVNGTEKWGGRMRHQRGMQEFQRALEDCGLSDLGFCGSKYTWSNCQDGINFIKERLDRGVANLEWRHYYPEAMVNVDAAVSSDHAPLILSLLNNGSKVARKSFFRFEAGWALNDGYKYEVSTIWNLPWPGKMGWECLSNKLSACMLKITHWNEGFSKPSQNRLACMRARLAELQGMERMGNSESMVRLKRDIETLTEQEDLWWRQREGDLGPCLLHVEKCVQESMNAALVEDFTAEEISAALNQMASLKAPGPDGLDACFFQQNWTLMGEEVLANRLKKILPHIISLAQSAFIPRRLITDNILAAYETLHTMHTGMRGKKGFMAIKLDMSKAYDRVEWRFLEALMRKMGFHEKWIRLVMMCVFSVHYSILMHGEPCGNITPSRGIRQGDPISPYLFLLCAEVLSSMVLHANREGLLSGVPTSRKGPKISHLFFADDSLLFCRTTLAQWSNMLAILRQYEAASGQKMNAEKTSIVFSRNAPTVEKDTILEFAGLPATCIYEKYLGLPALVGRS
ncbi:uncharacterized protein LOC132169350 [Corylus avellana]|uniref:uncharacterized protein LOC132169350 n=1 Tax=Corylus avellana TaxID=13451 RepID=UPI00286C9CAF|nr:uncharacterized protein LOC132169350 [Corylus avellana]